jgi:hypothetical protein
MTLDEWLYDMPEDEREAVCLADAWNYQQARIDLLEAAIREALIEWYPSPPGSYYHVESEYQAKEALYAVLQEQGK